MFSQEACIEVVNGVEGWGLETVATLLTRERPIDPSVSLYNSLKSWRPAAIYDGGANLLA